MATTYQYKPISPETGTIRLLRIFKSPPTDPIRCELFEASLHEDDGITYQALSYTWGSNAAPESITIEDEVAGGQRVSSTLYVTSNLHTALRYIRSRELDLVLWIDAICIDQQNPQEKSIQIGQMKTVYKKADEVLIWLGHSTDENLEAAMDAMCRLHDEARSDRKAWRDPEKRLDVATLVFRWQFANVPGTAYLKQIGALKELFQRPWFQRIWIIQEVASARAATVLCGSRSVPAAIFALMPTLLGIEVDQQVQAVLDVLPGRSRQESWWNKRRDLLYLLKMFATSQTSEPRDKVYALLGISSDASNTELFCPNYQISVEQTLRNTLSFLVFGSILPPNADEEIKLPKISLLGLIHFADSPGAQGLVSYILQWSIRGRYVNTTRALLKHNGFSLAREYWNEFIEAGDSEDVVDYIFRHQCLDSTAKNGLGETPLEVAARKGDVKTTKLILQLYQCGRDTSKALDLAARLGHFSVVHLLSERYHLGKSTQTGCDPKPAWAERTEQKDSPQEQQPRVDLRDVHHAALSAVMANGSLEALRNLIEYGVEHHGYRDDRGRTLVSLAALRGSAAILEYLLHDLGGITDIDSRDVDGRTALSFAAEKGRFYVIRILVDAGADAAAKDLNGRRIVDWLEDPEGKERRRRGEWGSHLAEWRSYLAECRSHLAEWRELFGSDTAL